MAAGIPTTISGTTSKNSSDSSCSDQQTSSALSAAYLALETFNSRLPSTCKPRPAHEWTSLAAVVLSIHAAASVDAVGSDPPPEARQICCSLATGTKCLPASALKQARGKVLHDSHAEILALRGFSRWILEEIGRIVGSGGGVEGEDSCCGGGDVLELTTGSGVATDGPSGRDRKKRWKLKDNVKVHLVSTAAPCGSASLELLMRTKDGDDEPWEVMPTPIVSPTVSEATESLHDPEDQHSTHDQNSPPSIQRGHGGFHHVLLSAVRTKPARRDAPPTLSKSCSDKLSLAQVQGLLRFPADLFVESVCLDTLIVPESAYHAKSYERAFGRIGRMAVCCDDACASSRSDLSTRSALWQTHYFSTVVLKDADLPFEFSKDIERGRTKVSNVSALYVNRPDTITPVASSQENPDIIESLINGVKQGFRQDSSHLGKESAVSRRQMWLLGKELADGLVVMSEKMSGYEYSEAVTIQDPLVSRTYRDVKGYSLRAPRTEAKKEAVSRLGGWIANAGDDNWGIDR